MLSEGVQSSFEPDADFVSQPLLIFSLASPLNIEGRSFVKVSKHACAESYTIRNTRGHLLALLCGP